MLCHDLGLRFRGFPQTKFGRPTKGWFLAWPPVPYPGTEAPKEPHLSPLPRVPVAGLTVVWARKTVLELPSFRSELALKDHAGLA